MSNCEEPWNDLSTRKQRALLLEGVEITRAFLVRLKELMQMNNDEGEPCSYDEVLQAVLHHGSACARGAKKANRLDISEESVPPAWYSKIKTRAVDDAAYELRFTKLPSWATFQNGDNCLTSAQLRGLRQIFTYRFIPSFEEIQEYRALIHSAGKTITPETSSKA